MNILETIIKTKQQEIAIAKAKLNQTDLQIKLGKQEYSQRNFLMAIAKKIQLQQNAIIAEIKKASPSKGVICESFDPIAIAKDYAEAGATCLSVLTDKEYFQGSPEYLKLVRNTCPLPILRKDFIIDPYQVYQSKLWQADCILLIVAALEPKQLYYLTDLARDLELSVLIEVHNQAELEIALQANSLLLGINNRNLKTFSTDLQTTLNLLPNIPEEKLVITESGIHTIVDIEIMHAAKVFGFLVGESMMRAESPGQKLRELFFQRIPT